MKRVVNRAKGMHVLLVSIDSSVLAGGSVVGRLREFAARVGRLSVIVFGRGLPRQVADNVWVYPANCSKALFVLKAARMGAVIAKERSIDVVVSQDAHATGVAGVLIKRKVGAKLQVQLHGDYVRNEWTGSFVKRLVLDSVALWCLRRADSVRVVSARVERKLLSLGVAKEKIVCFPVFTDVSRFARAKKAKLSGSPVFLFVGRLSSEKNVGLLLDAFAGVRKSLSGASLYIVGDGRERARLERLASGLGVEECVVFVGSADPAPFYRAASAFVLPSWHEGWALVAIEAAAAGCPVVMSDVGCAGEVIINGRSGLVVPVGDGVALADAMRRIVTDSNLAKRLAIGAKREVARLPSKEKSLGLAVSSWASLAGEVR